MEFLQAVLILLGSMLLHRVDGRECLNLETGDVSGFDIAKYSGTYQLVMGVRDGPATAGLKANCIEIEIIQHPHPRGGVNINIVYKHIDGTILDIGRPHFNTSTGIYAEEIDAYDRFLSQWTDFYYKILLATDELLVFTKCIIDEDNVNETQYFVFVLRKEGSTLAVSDIQKMLPDSVKNISNLEVVCD